MGTPSIVTLIQEVSSPITLADIDRDAMIRTMRMAAEKRVERILGNSRCRHYSHAAMLAASCVAIAPTDRGKDVSDWVAGLRETYKRRHAFREELTRAMVSLGLTPRVD